MNAAQQAFVDGLRELADHLEANPDLIPTYSGVQLNQFADEVDEFVVLSRQLGGDRVKGGDTGFADVSRSFGPHSFSVNIRRDRICERVVTGSRHVETSFVEAHEVEVVEWRCEPVILGAITA